MINIHQDSSWPPGELPLLQNGDHLDQSTFHALYEAMPADFHAELINGVVYLRGCHTASHGRSLVSLGSMLDIFDDATPGTKGLIKITNILGPISEPEPDGCLLILPEYGGQTWCDADDFVNGAPDWVAEISDGTEAVDLGVKKQDYENAGVREYMVAVLKTRSVFWFVQRSGKLKERSAAPDGIFRSEAVPGFWVDPDAFLNHARTRLLTILRQGLASPEHAAFVAKLAAKKA
jgi:Uma2 family endonuclease